MMFSKRILFLALLMAVTAPWVNAAMDTVVLKDGRKLEGSVLEQNENQVTIKVSGANIVLPMSMIEKIEKQELAVATDGEFNFRALYPIAGRQDRQVFEATIAQYDLSKLTPDEKAKLDQLHKIVKEKPVDIEAVKAEYHRHIKEIRGYAGEQLLKDALKKNPYNLELRNLLIDYWRQFRKTGEEEFLYFVAEHCSYYPDLELPKLAKDIQEQAYNAAKDYAERLRPKPFDAYLFLQLHAVAKAANENQDKAEQYVPALLAAIEDIRQNKIVLNKAGATMPARLAAALVVKDDSSRKEMDLTKADRERRERDWANYQREVDRGRTPAKPEAIPPYEFALPLLYDHPIDALKHHIRNTGKGQWDREVEFYRDFLNWAMHYWALQSQYTLESVKRMHELSLEMAAVQKAKEDDPEDRDATLAKLNAPLKDRATAALEFLRTYRGRYHETVWFYTYEQALKEHAGDDMWRDKYDQDALDRIMNLLTGLERESDIPDVTQRVKLTTDFVQLVLEQPDLKDRYIALRDTAETERNAYDLYLEYRHKNTRDMNQDECRRILNILTQLQGNYADTRWVSKFEECKKRYQDRLDQIGN